MKRSVCLLRDSCGIEANSTFIKARLLKGAEYVCQKYCITDYFIFVKEFLVVIRILKNSEHFYYVDYCSGSQQGCRDTLGLPQLSHFHGLGLLLHLDVPPNIRIT